MENIDQILWTASREFSEKTYVAKLMKKMGVGTREALWKKSVEDVGEFWDVVVKDLGIEWFHPYHNVLDKTGGIEWSKWFVGGKLNIAHNCVDRHAQNTKTALAWEGDGGEKRELSYIEFAKVVNQAANALKALGIRRGDCVGILMPMTPEVVIQLFACLKVGAVAIPIFSGFGPDAIAGRLEAAQAKVLFTSDVSFRRGKPISVKDTADQATKDLPHLKHRIVFKRGDGKCAWDASKDKWWHEFVLTQPDVCPSEVMESEDPSIIIFTSGTTGKPKGAVHTHAGALAQVCKELRYAFNVDHNSRFFWFTDIGWMMGPWEMIGVTFFGGTLFLYEGAPDYPTPERLWQLIENNHLTVLGISPTAIRLLMRYGEEAVEKYRFPTLELLGSTGEPWDPESYLWYFKHVGKSRCPVINISGGTEIIGCLLSPLPIDSLKPCSLGGPALGVDVDVFDEEGWSVRGGIGHLVCKQPIPSMTKGFLGDKQRYLETYFSKFKGVWYHGDWAHVDKDGHWFLHGRSDDTIKVAGKRVGPVEYEAALIKHPAVSEAAAVGVPDPLKGEVCVVYAVLKPGNQANDALRVELEKNITGALGKTLAAKEVRFARTLPKTRSAKILRGLIRKIYLKEPLGDTASVENPDAITAIQNAE